jgi:hypothetical protein
MYYFARMFRFFIDREEIFAYNVSWYQNDRERRRRGGSGWLLAIGRDPRQRPERPALEERPPGLKGVSPQRAGKPASPPVGLRLRRIHAASIV